MAVIFNYIVDGDPVNAATVNAPIVEAENAILDVMAGTGFDNQAQNFALLGPASGGVGAVSFRALVEADIPSLNASKIGAGELAIVRGGTGAGTKTLAMDALSPSTTLGDLMAHDGTNNVRLARGGNGQVLFTDDAEPAGLVWGDLPLAGGQLGGESTLVIATGAITATSPHHWVDTESAAATDDLETINGLNSGDVLFIRAADTTRDVVVKHGIGNIRMNGGTDFTLDNDEKGVLFVKSGTYVIGVGIPVTSGAGSGTVTSVGATVPSQFSVSGSPVTTSGTLAISWQNQVMNRVLAGPASGSDAVPTFRALVADDIPSLDAAKIATGTLDVARIPDLDAAKVISGTFNVLRIPNLDAAKIISGTFNTARIPNLDASKINSGTFSTARIPTLTNSFISDRGMTELVAFTSLGAPATSIDMSSISSGYSHLRLYLLLRSDRAGIVDNVLIRLNNDSTTTNYISLGQRVRDSATLTTVEHIGTQTAIQFNLFAAGNTAPANLFGFGVFDIFGYASTAVRKFCLWNGMVMTDTTAGNIYTTQGAGYYNQTTAINRVTVIPGIGTNWLAGSGYALYGIG